MIHINELKFEGNTPWIKAMNLANEYWTKYCDENLSLDGRNTAFDKWRDIRFEIESGVYGNNS